jgi:hypothetical protein
VALLLKGRQRYFDGEKILPTEGLPALASALRKTRVLFNQARRSQQVMNKSRVGTLDIPDGVHGTNEAGTRSV